MRRMSRQKQFPRIPYATIRWLIDRLHVGVEAEEIREDMERRLSGRSFHQKSCLPGCASCEAVSPEETQECVRHALAVHAENRALYDAVMLGRLG
jgi:hypothetical protein